MQLWRIVLKPKGAAGPDVTQACVDRSIVGFGGPISSPPTDIDDYKKRGLIEYEAINKGESFKRNSKQFIDNMRIGDFIWTRTDEPRTHYLGKITSDWRYDETEQSELSDIVNIRSCDWREVVANDVPADLSRHFTPATVQQIRESEKNRVLWEESLALYARFFGDDAFADENEADQREEEIRNADELDETEKEQLNKLRRGQARFRQLVLEIEPACRVTGVTDRRLLIASHIKPWRSSSNAERLDGNNGLMLTPNIDHLFDHGFISFSDEGTLLISPNAGADCIQLLGDSIHSPFNCGEFTEQQQHYLAHHRCEVFRT